MISLPFEKQTVKTTEFIAIVGTSKVKITIDSNSSQEHH
jgi:hypothetical protein